MKKVTLIIAFWALLATSLFAARSYEETAGIVAVEAEHFVSQAKDSIRRWYVVSEGDGAANVEDRDRNHAASASGKRYIEILPDNRVTHDDALIEHENFSPTPGLMGILSYPIYFNTPGEYTVWVRAFSTGFEDNGIHVGINGAWPESGQRIQLCEDKHRWTWSSAQRVETNHCGVDRTIKITVPEAGLHTINFSMREDGFELDKFLMVREESYQPEGEDVAATYSESETLAALNARSAGSFDPIYISAVDDFGVDEVDGFVSYYTDKARGALAINAANPDNRDKFAASQYTFSGKEGMYTLSLYTMCETDGDCNYVVKVNGTEVLKHKNAPTQIDYFVNEKHAAANVALTPGDIIQVESNAVTNGLFPEGDITAFARGRWTEIMLIPAGPIVAGTAKKAAH